MAKEINMKTNHWTLAFAAVEVDVPSLPRLFKDTQHFGSYELLQSEPLLPCFSLLLLPSSYFSSVLLPSPFPTRVLFFTICSRVYDPPLNSTNFLLSLVQRAISPPLLVNAEFAFLLDTFAKLCLANSFPSRPTLLLFSATAIKFDQSPQVPFYFIIKCFVTATFSSSYLPLLIEGGSGDNNSSLGLGVAATIARPRTDQ